MKVFENIFLANSLCVISTISFLAHKIHYKIERTFEGSQRSDLMVSRLAFYSDNLSSNPAEGDALIKIFLHWNIWTGKYEQKLTDAKLPQFFLSYQNDEN